MHNLSSSLPFDPLALFRDWYEAAKASEISDPNAMTLATMGADGYPATRIVLLKNVSQAGFVFYTNRLSRKGRELAALPKAALGFHWKSLERQVRVQGDVQLLPDADSDAYFASRPRASQIGAWASIQSAPLVDREVLEQRCVQTEQQFAGQDVPRPPHWGGYLVAPIAMEFWQAHPHRLHDRALYLKDASGAWLSPQRLYP